jgi:HTH-type transcriptional regulator / antitoxin HigA
MEMSARVMDRGKYKRLLVRVAPTAIESEAENERALGILERLLEKGEAKLTPEEDALVELLTQLVENFEKRAYPRKKSAPPDLIRFLLEQKRLKPVNLAEVLGSRGRVSEILSGKRSVSKEQAKRLGAFFRVSPALFI